MCIRDRYGTAARKGRKNKTGGNDKIMLRLFRHLKGSYRYIVCIVLLLLLQANCDLALPSYTSNIVNVGIQDVYKRQTVSAFLRKGRHFLRSQVLFLILFRMVQEPAVFPVTTIMLFWT